MDRINFSALLFQLHRPGEDLSEAWRGKTCHKNMSFLVCSEISGSTLTSWMSWETHHSVKLQYANDEKVSSLTKWIRIIQTVFWLSLRLVIMLTKWVILQGEIWAEHRIAEMNQETYICNNYCCMFCMWQKNHE